MCGLGFVWCAPRSRFLLAILVVPFPVLYAMTDHSSSIPYPAGYRKWGHVKTMLVGPQSQFFKSSGGIHHIYANEKGMEGYTKGRFPNEAILVFDLFQTKEGDGITAEGRRQRIDVMVRDSKRFSSSGGWGFERFLGDSEKPTLSEDHRKQCFDCHLRRKDHDLVFSEYRN